jgi:hypothetical protein
MALIYPSYIILTNMLSILDTATHLRRVVWSRETILGASKRPHAGMENLGHGYEFTFMLLKELVTNLRAKGGMFEHNGAVSKFLN